MLGCVYFPRSSSTLSVWAATINVIIQNQGSNIYGSDAAMESFNTRNTHTAGLQILNDMMRCLSSLSTQSVQFLQYEPRPEYTRELSVQSRCRLMIRLFFGNAFGRKGDSKNRSRTCLPQPPRAFPRAPQNLSSSLLACSASRASARL